MDDARLHGILVALVTPFTDDGQRIDGAALTDLVRHLLRTGVHGLVPGGTTGEFTVLSDAERRQLTELTIEAANGQIPVVVGTGALAPATTISLSEHAQESGAAAVMVTPPFYDPLRFPELVAFLRQVSAAIDIPIVYYNVPGATGLHLRPAQLAELGSIDGVDYIKDTSGDAVALTEMLTARRDAITTFNGWDTLTFTGLTLGATGSVWGAANLVPGLAVQLWDAVAVRGDLDEGRRLWSMLWPICDLLEANNYVAGMKAGLELLGRPVGPVRAPILALENAQRDRLHELLTAAGAVPASP
jgi:dihydrodipicolinate synthase/N-acetylneuraminate lyase